MKASDIYPQSNLTKLQLLYWTAQELRPAVPFLNTILAFHIDGPVSREHFNNAFQALVSQSDALRTVIGEADGVPQRCVPRVDNYELPYLDFSHETHPTVAARSWMQRRSAIPLKLDERLFDSALLKIAPEQFLWYINQHHIIADASSFFVLFRHLEELYERSLQGQLDEAPILPSFEKYASYERDYHKSANSIKAENYWTKKLEPGPEYVRFFGRQPVKKTSRVTRVSHRLSHKQSEQLRNIARQEGIFTVSEDLSLYNLFASLYFAQLHQLSGNRRLGVVTPVHNRFTEQFRNTIGLIMELCPLQVEISEDDTFISLLKKVKRETRGAMVHYQVASALALDNKAFDVMFNMYHTPVLTLNGAGVQAERIHPGYGAESLVLHVNDHSPSECFELYFDFHEDVFSASERRQIADAFVQLIDAFLADGTQPVESVNYLATPDVAHTFDRPEDNTGGTRAREQGRAQWYRSLVARRDPLELQLTQIWEKLFGVRPIGVTDNFFDLGGSSFLAVRLFAEIEKLTGKNLSLSTLLEAGTIEDQARLLREEGWSSSASEAVSSLVPLQPHGTRPPFFCMHGGGGNVIHYRMLAHHLGSDQPFYGLQPRGIDGTAPFHTTVEQMAAYYIEQIQTVQPKGPYFLGGYCFGATVAFEVAQQLQRLGQQVAVLVSLDGATPDYPDLLPSRSERASEHLTRILGTNPEKAFSYITGRIARRSTRLWKRTKKQLRRKKLARKLFPGLGKPVPHPPHHHEMVQTLRRAYRQYKPQLYPGELIVFRGARKHDHTLGWGRLVSDGVKVHELAISTSMDMFKEPHVEVLARKLRSCLDEAKTGLQSNQELVEHASNQF